MARLCTVKRSYAKPVKETIMPNEIRNVRDLLNEVVLISIALFFPLAQFLVLSGVAG